MIHPAHQLILSLSDFIFADYSLTWMADFTKKIDTASGRLIFNFTRIYSVNGPVYFISVLGRATQKFFHMEKRKGEWKIIEKPEPPSWVIEYEKQLAEEIDQRRPE